LQQIAACRGFAVPQLLQKTSWSGASVVVIAFLSHFTPKRAERLVTDNCCTKAITRFDRWSMSDIAMFQQSTVN
jgi:hypothetical protein